MVAVYWAPVSLGDTGRVYYRETEGELVRAEEYDNAFCWIRVG